MELESKQGLEGAIVKVRLPIGIIAVGILVSDYMGAWGHPHLTAAAVHVVAFFQIVLCITYVVFLWGMSEAKTLPSMTGTPLLRRYLYVVGFAVVYAATEHWWLAIFQLCVLVTLTAFVVEHKNKSITD